MTPTVRTLKWLRDHGYTAGIVEKTVPKSFIKQDLFGFIDIIALGDGEILGVQVTSGTNHAARKHKILSHENFVSCDKAGLIVEIHSWRKSAKDKKWKLRIERLTD